jgi:hypothetical protein
MSKTILVMGIALAFIAGTLTSGTMAFASGDKNGKPFEEIWAAIHSLETAISEMEYVEDSQGDSGSDDISALEARITSLENSNTNSGDYTIVYSGTRLEQVKIFEPHEVALIQTPTCPKGEFAAGFGINQQIGIPATLKPLEIGTLVQTPISDFGKLAVRGTNPNDVPLTASFEIFCGKIVPLDTLP